MGGGHRKRSDGRERGADLSYNMEVTLEEAFSGKPRKLIFLALLCAMLVKDQVQKRALNHKLVGLVMGLVVYVLHKVSFPLREHVLYVMDVAKLLKIHVQNARERDG